MSDHRETIDTASLAETIAAGKAFAERLAAGDAVALSGCLGAGKTQFVRGVAAGLGLDSPAMVTSPTFVICNEYPARMPVFHLDAYRLSEPAAELLELGLDEMLETGVVLLEWAELARGALPATAWRVQIDITGPDSRRITLWRNS